MQQFSRRKFGFECAHCKQHVVVNDTIGTQHRNHCPFCLYSLHVDFKKPGDRKSTCHGEMQPVGLVFKNEKADKYGKVRVGELMLIHYCTQCFATSQNRIAADDKSEKILEVFDGEKSLSQDIREKLDSEGIVLLSENDKSALHQQLFGKL